MRIAVLLPTLLLTIIQCFAQENNSWLAGRWNGAGDVPKSYIATHIIRSMDITLGQGDTYSCLYTNAINDRNGSMKKVMNKGRFYDNKFHTISSEVIYQKNPPGARWVDCDDCDEKEEIIIEEDKIKILYLIPKCRPACDGTGYFYKDLSSFDLPMQRYLVKRFGTPTQLERFEAVYPEKPIVKPAPPETTTVKIPSKPIRKPVTPLNSRKTTPLNTYSMTEREITLELYDDATEDGDTISVYDNGRLIVDKLGLKNAPQQIKLFIDDNNKKHIIILVAENLGTIPPNTAVLKVTAGGIKEELQVRLTLKQNASITFYYTGD
jgi:hypothetical protein